MPVYDFYRMNSQEGKAMCGRYAILEEEAILEMREIINQVNEKFSERQGLVVKGEVKPSNLAPVLRAEQDKVRLDVMKWGFPRWDQSSGLIINARSETVMEKPLFRDSFLNRRVVIPSSGFYEWDHRPDHPKDKYFFTLQGMVSYMAGFYNRFTLKDGQIAECFVILTAPAIAPVAELHDRMPVILPRQKIRLWLDPRADATALLQGPQPTLVSFRNGI